MVILNHLPETTKVHHISHDDLDGVSAILITKALLPSHEVTSKPVSNGSVDKEVLSYMEEWEKDTLLVITDVSVSEEVAEELDKRVMEGYQLLLIDHHKTALWLNKYHWAKVELELHGQKASATSSYLFHHFVNVPRKVAEYAELVRLYDTWEWSTTESPEGVKAKQLNDLFFMLGKLEYEDFVVTSLHDLLTDNFEFGDKETILIENEQKRIEAYIRVKEKQFKVVDYEFEGTTYKMGIVTNESYHSELGNALCNKHPEVDFVLMIDVGRKKCSLRTVRPDLDVSLIAKSYGGGGHPASSGFLLEQPEIEQILIPYLSMD